MPFDFQEVYIPCHRVTLHLKSVSMLVFISTHTMKNYWKSLFFILITFTTTIATAQENCGNGIDDDGDSLIDCYDGDCSDSSECEGFFFGNTVTCADDINVTTFAIREQWGSEDGTATSHAAPAIGDLDGNGIPEVVSINNYGRPNLYVLNGATGATIASADIGFTPENAPVIAKIDGDDAGDIIVSQNDGHDLAMYNVDISAGTLTQRWRSSASVNQAVGLPGVADFDEDGDVEIYYRNEVMDARTGTVIIAGDGFWYEDYTHGSLAVDILPASACADCAGLELISGNEVWAINESAGTRTLVRDMDDDIHSDIDLNLNYYPKYISNTNNQWSTVSAADYNLDGNIDIFMSGALGTSSEKSTGETTIFFWDVTNGTVITYHDPTNDFERGPGRINIGDVDGDGQPNANFVMDQKLYSLDENFNVHWIHPIREGSSGFSGCSLFDFDGDGAVEVVYRSEESLLIIDGVGNGDNTTSQRSEIACVSRTQEEYPIVADVDGDGSSEICVSCYTNNSTPFNPYNNTQYSQIRAYESDGEAWMPARGVWNQHGYYNVNINDDLTVPIEMQDHSAVFSSAGSCESSDGSTIPFDTRPLNTFLNQTPILNEEGCIAFASPDIHFEGIVSATDAQCPNAETTVEFEIVNRGDIDISGNLPVSYYHNDPRTSDGVLLDTKVTVLENFGVNETLIVEQAITGVGGDFELFVVINDNGGTPPLTVPLPTSTIPECETGNNIQSTLVGFETFDLVFDIINDNRKCDLLKPDNGNAEVYYFGSTSGSNETFWLENFEDRTNAATFDTDETAWTSDPGSESPGFYGVVNYNGSKMFRATQTGIAFDAGLVTWTSEDIDISDHTDVSVGIDIFEDGIQEGSGMWRDFVRVSYEIRDTDNMVTETGQFTNGFQVGDFTYARASLSDLNSDDDLDSLLIITVEIHNNGSQEHHYIDNISINGINPGVLNKFTESNGFVFRWYNDDDYSTVIYEGSQYSQIADGNYDVIGYYGQTECYSDTVDIGIQLVTPTVNVWAYEINPLTQCNIPDGSVGAFVYTRTELGTFPANDTDNTPLDTLMATDGYGFTWRDNNDITNTVIATANVIQNLLAKEYAVDVIDGLTGCIATALVEVTTSTEAVNDPNVGIIDISVCQGTGRLTADVDGNTADFIFEWYDGTGVKPVADFTGSSYEVADDGNYTVVATSNISGCKSDPITATLNDNSIAPRPTATLVQNNTSCVAGNGIVSADGDGSGTISGYTFEWFYGANTLLSNELPGTAVPGTFLVSDNPYELGGLEAGTYTVRVTDNASSCFESRAINVIDNPGLLNVAARNIIQNNINSCNATILGSIDASGVVPSNISSISLGNINSSFEDLDILTNNDQLQTFNGGNVKTYTQTFIDGWSTTAVDQRIEIWHSNNTLEGSIHNAYHGDQFAEINANVTAALYFDLATTPGTLLNWSFAHKGRSGTDELSVNIGEPGSEVSQGSFSTGNTNWAFYDGEYIIPADQFTTRFQFEAVNTATGNNSIGNFVDTVSFVLFPYRFDLYEGTTTSGTADYMNTSGQFGDLDQGDYVLVIYDNLTGCDAVEVPITITRSLDQPTLVINVTDDDRCNDDAGSVDISASMLNLEPTSYTYQIFDEHSFANQIGSDQTATDGSVPFTFSDLALGDYRIRITNDDTQCTSFEDIVIDDITVIPTFLTNPTINDNTSCDPATPNGFLSVGIEGDVVGNYLFTWYDGDSRNSTLQTPPTLGNNDLDRLAAGDYTVVAEHTVTGCETVELTLNVATDPYIPNIIITEDAPQTTCGIGNGILSAYIDNNPDLPPGTRDVSGFSFQWQLDGVGLVDGATALNGTVPAGAQTPTVSGLIADEYTLVITHTNTDCSATESFTLSENQIISVVNLANTQPNTGCDPATFNGEILITVTPSDTYDFDWFYSDGTPVTDGGTVSGSDTENLIGVINDTYKVVATSALFCSSDTLSIIVASAPSVISVNGTIQPLTVCVPSTVDPDGQITINPVTAGGEPAGGYNIQWFFGSGTTDTLDATDLVDSDALTGTSATGSTTPLVTNGLEAGTYTVQVINVNTLCRITEEFTIFDNSVNPAFNDPAVDVSPVDMVSCPGGTAFPDGGVIVDLAAITGSGNYTVNYFFGGAALPVNQLTVDGSVNIFDQKGIPGTAVIPISETTDNTTTASITGLNPGDYTVVVIDNGTGCTTAEITVTVDATPVSFTPAITLISNQTSCDFGAPNGQLEASIAVGVSRDLNDYNIQWFTGQNTDAANAITTGLSGTNNSIVSNLPAGIYTLLATERNSNCFTSAEQTIVLDTENPAFVLGTVSSNTSCNAPDGSIPFTINGLVRPFSPFDGDAGYTVDLYIGTTIGTSAIPVTTLIVDNGILAEFSNLQDNTYSIRATDINTNCVVEALGIVVPYAGVTASFDEAAFFRQDISACFQTDGIIDIGSGITLNNEYIDGDMITITWYAGTDTSVVDNLLSNLHNITPAITTRIHMADLTILDGDGDRITILNGRIGDNPDVLTSGLPAISYTGVATLPNGCIELFSTSLTFTTAPVITTTSVNPARCLPPFDGQISITLDADPGNRPNDYSYYVFEGPQSILPDRDGATPYNPALGSYGPIVTNRNFTDNTPGATETIDLTDDPVLGQLEAGIYTIGVEILADNCIVYVGTVVLDDPEEPNLILDNSTNNSICDPALNYNGEITVSRVVNPLFPGDFDFTWFEDLNSNGTYNPLRPGSGSGPGLNVTGETATGTITTVTGLSTGRYRVIGIHDATQCPDTLDIQLFDEIVTLSVGNNAIDDWFLSDIENCDEEGAFRLMRILQDGLPDTDSDTETEIQAGFTLTWNDLTSGTPFAPNLSETEANDLAAGTYRIDIEDDLTGCVTSYQFTILDTTLDPVISLDTRSDDTYCDGPNNIGDGAITINLTEDGGAPITLTDYSVAWYRGTFLIEPGILDPDFLHDDVGNVGTPANVGSASVGVDILSLDELEAGTYTVFAIKDNGDASGNGNEGCDVFATFTIDADQPSLTVNSTSIRVEDNDNCTPPNGLIRINQITIDGVTTPLNDASPYNITWTVPGIGTPGTSNPGVSIANDQLTGVDAGTYSFTITHNTTGCATATIDVDVEDLQINPLINGAASTEDTYCDNTNNEGNGSLSIDLTEDGGAPITLADYSVAWYRGTFTTEPGILDSDFLHDDVGNPSGPTAGSARIDGDILSLDELAAGTYTVFAIKDNGDLSGNGNEGCTATATFNVGSMNDIPTLNAADIRIRTQPDSLCTGNSGTLIINDTDVSTGDLTDFEIRIYTGAIGVGELPGSPYTNIPGTSIPYTTLSAADYYITAENTTTGCFATTAIVHVTDSERDPQVTLVSETPDEDCGGGVNAGSLEVLIDNQFDDTDHFDVQWFTGFDAIAGNEIAGATSVTLPNIAEGLYSVSVRNQNTDCSRFRNYTITNVPVAPSISDHAIGENNICDDDNDNIPVDVGTFELLETTFDGTALDQTAMTGNYRLEIYDDPDTGVGVAIADGDGDPANFIYTELGAGKYFAFVRKLDSDCISGPTEFDIIDNVLRPVVTIVLQVADSTCAAGGTPNGSLRATATVGPSPEIDDTDPDYTFQWYLGSGTTPPPMTDGVDPGNGSNPLGVATSNVSGLVADTYTVEVIRASTGCITLEEFELPNAPSVVEIRTVSTTDVTNCMPGNGTITVDEVNRHDVADYNFDYYDTDPTVGSPAPAFTGNAGAMYSTAAAGTYWIIGTNTIVNCATPAFEVEVGEMLMYPAIELDDFDFQANCDLGNPNGRLLVLADGQPANAMYDFEWYFGTGTDNPLTQDDYPGGVNLTGESTNEVSGLASGFYTVEVTNNFDCTSTETYQMADNFPRPIAISTSSSANTNCNNWNGKAAVSVISPASGRSITDYSYYWFIGDLATVGTPDIVNADYTGTLIENIPAGDYVVLVIDLIDNFCQSMASQVTVQDGTNLSEYSLTLNDVTVCFDDKNGFATVSIPDLSTVDIAWYDDTNNIIGSTPYVDFLDAGVYRLELTHVITGCVTQEVFNILNNAVTSNDPFVLVNNGRNNCQFSNGNAVVNVDGVTRNYLFEWFDPDNMTTPYTTGSEVFNLDTITYLVRATNLATGCQSAFTSADIKYEVIDPVYEVLLNNSVCLRTEDGSTNQFTGSAIIQFAEFQLSSSYEWKNSSGVVVGTDSRLIDAPPGDYTVTFTAKNGCTYNAAFTIETSLTIYNGVSANGDSRNDFFLIDCIGYFPNNNLKVFNRAGRKVYAIDGYNNTSIRFEGISNVGGGGLRLPTGTYFYVIDLGNGENPVQGYLELVR